MNGAYFTAHYRIRSSTDGTGRVALLEIIIVQVVDVVVPITELCEWVGETVNVKTEDVVGVDLVSANSTDHDII